ncbi:MAG: hypothetical protein ACI8QZ_001624 [Chlamydiales bacterium]|jgi:hypothetical protein
MNDTKKGSLAISVAAVLWTGMAAASAGDEEPWTKTELERVTAKIQEDVEVLRGLKFKRPVAVELSDKAGFLAHATARMDQLTPAGKLAHDQDIARHLGMIPPDMHLLKVTMDLLAEQVGGFYSPASEAFYLMPTFTGDAARIILAHELTHALDDQHFDLDGGFERALSSTDASTAYASVVEGSGTMLMTRWLFANMSEISPAALQEAGSVGADALSAAPPYIWLPLMSVYMQGQAFLTDGYNRDRKAAKADGRKADPNASLDRAFANPPRSTEQVLHPAKYWGADERDEPRGIRHELAAGLDALPDGWQELERDVLGEMQLGILTMPFDERSAPDMTDPMAAMALRYTNEAATGWGGDEVLLLGRGDARVVHLVTCWDSAQDAQEFITAMRAIAEGVRTGLGVLAGGVDGAFGLSIRAGSVADRVLVSAWSGVHATEVEALVASLVISEPAR